MGECFVFGDLSGWAHAVRCGAAEPCAAVPVVLWSLSCHVQSKVHVITVLFVFHRSAT